jgi:3-methylfumaryl-CoA hydratase
MIFRLSAVRFNSHRVHYDRDYTTKEEGYPGLLVPVTLVSFLMMEMCRAEATDRPMTSFSYQSENPIFDLGLYKIFGAPEGDKVKMWSTDYQDDLAITATATLGD